MIEELVKQVNKLQKQIDALVKPEVNRWMDWTPVVTQGVAITTTISCARYTIIGETVVIYARILTTSAGTAANAIVISNFPSTIAPANSNTYEAIGVFFYRDNSAANPHYNAILTAHSATEFRALGSLTTSYFGISPAITVANDDLLSFSATYERA